MDWARFENGPHRACKNSDNMETGWQKKTRKTKNYMEEDGGERDEIDGYEHVGRCGKSCEKPSFVEKLDERPYSPQGEKDISQVKI